MIEAAYITALSAIVGTFVGGVTSIATSWVGQRYQIKEQRIARERVERPALYRQFILDASKLYVDALEHDKTEISELVDIYSTVNRIRVQSSKKVIDEADKALRTIIGVYSDKNKSFSDLAASVNGNGKSDFPDPLRDFSQACREDLETY
jgi:hypothetical protein